MRLPSSLPPGWGRPGCGDKNLPPPLTLTLPRKEGGDKEKYQWLLLVFLFSFLLLFTNPATALDNKFNTDGAWFLC